MPEEHTTQQPTPQIATPVQPIAPLPTTSNFKNSLGIPIAIVLAAALIAGAIYMSGTKRGQEDVDVTGAIGAAQNGQAAQPVVAPVTEKDHIKGDPNAPILLVEYSDYDCPFCRIYHDTMTKIMNEYGKTGKVAWVFRNFPLKQLHPNAPKIAEASYCVTELGKNEAFWKFTDALNNSRKIEYGADGNIKDVEETDMTRLSEFAVSAGVDKGKFELCYNSGKYADQVEADVKAALATGARGTPYTVVMVGGQQGVVSGAQPYDSLKQMVDNLISQMEGGAKQ